LGIIIIANITIIIDIIMDPYDIEVVVRTIGTVVAVLGRIKRLTYSINTAGSCCITIPLAVVSNFFSGHDLP
jgi:hypothetical protein